ncbi:hypothetical protein DV701_07335 [Ornithinimicrobium avium]|uniref:Uncharacterized protein n=1 Tax=Ornithinimicrobium avium TaxID=2283195 RepID=A0A345NLQ1_9MICO|nr:hypothetical protein DV701_07335 [Ornithinimicrobium avium]
MLANRWLLLITIGIVALGTSSIAALVIEDWTVDREGVRVTAVVLGGIFLVILYLASWYVTKRRGTLYYVRLLEEWMPDLYRDMQSQFGAEYSNEMVVAEHLTARSNRGVLDIADQVTSVTRRLQMLMSGDDLRTSYDVAPNMIWPAALAAGYHMHFPLETRLIEFAGEKMGWKLRSRANSPAGHDPRLRVHPTLPSEPDPDVGSVLLTVYMTPTKDPTRPAGLTVDREHTFGALDEADRPRAVLIVKKPTKSASGEVAVEARTGTTALVETITQTLAAYPNASVFLFARVAKTVALGAGHGLSGPGRADQMKREMPVESRRPWTRLVPVNVVQAYPHNPRDPSPACDLVRAAPGQPPSDQLARLAQKHGLWPRPCDPKTVPAQPEDALDER